MDAVEKGRRGAGWATVGVGLLVAVLHATWFAEDRRVPFMDQHRYYEMSAHAARCLDGTDDQGPLGLLTLDGSHPPLYAILGALTMSILGDGYASARLVNTVLAALTVLAAYLLGRRGLSPWGAWLGATLCAFAPLLFAFGHVYYIEALLLPLVLLSWWWVDASDGLSGRLSWIGMGVLLGLGCLAKWTYPVFVAVPVLLSVRRSRAWTGLLRSAMVAAVLAAPWYATNLGNMLEFFERGVVAGEGHLSARPGLTGWFYYPKEIALVGLGLPLTAFALAGWVSLLRTDPAAARRIAVYAIVPVVVFSAVMTKKPRHVLPVLPVLAIAAAHAVLSVRRDRLRWLIGSLLAAHVAAAALQGSFRLLDEDPVMVVAGRKITVLSDPSPIPGPPDDTYWPYEEILDALHDAGADDSRAPVLLLFNLTAFREDGFWYTRNALGRSVELGLISFSWPRTHEAFEPYPLSSAAKDTPGLLDARFVVVKTGRMWVRYGTGLALHEYGARTAESLMDPDSPLRTAFRPFREVPLPDGSRAVVFVTRDEPDRNAAIVNWAKGLLEEVEDPELLEGFRIGDDPAGAALGLAAAANDPATAVRWLRRALESDTRAEDRVRAALASLGVSVPAAPPPDLLAWLRQRDAGGR